MKYHIEFDLDFKRNPYNGLYIVFEGVNASGKSTQLEYIKNHFQKLGKKVIVTSEPNDELVIGKLIREILHKKIDVPMSSLQYLYTADRIVNHEKIVIPALKEGNVVLSSRSFWSAIVYGILDKGADYTSADKDLLLVAQGILSMYHQFIAADITFYLDVSIETVMTRIQQMDKSRDIYEKKEKLLQLIQGYKWLTHQFPKEFKIINGEQSIEDINAHVIQIISDTAKIV